MANRTGCIMFQGTGSDVCTRQSLELVGKIVSYSAFRNEQLDRLAGWISDNADIPGLLSLVGL